MNFKDEKGSWRTVTLFAERLNKENRDHYNPPYTLYEYDLERDGKVYKSLYLLYMDSIDEYDFVMTHLGGMSHWEKLCKSKWFGQGKHSHRGVAAWREDMRLRDESISKKALLEAIKKGS